MNTEHPTPSQDMPQFPELGPTGTEALAGLLGRCGKSINDVDETPPKSGT